MLSQLTRRSCALVLGALFVVCTAQAVRAQEQPRRPDEPHAADANPAANPAEKLPPIPPEKNSVTHHDLNLDGKVLHYTATAGTLLIRDGEDDHSVRQHFFRGLHPRRRRSEYAAGYLFV
jgi:carboxypeptidase C (cathepsin A)